LESVTAGLDLTVVGEGSSLIDTLGTNFNLVGTDLGMLLML
jgi:hypothetical protein